MRRSRLTALLLLSPWILSFLAFWLFPLIYSLIMGFTDYRLVARSWSWVGLDNYHTLLSDPTFLASIENTLIFVVGTVPITTILALALALLVNRQFPGRDIFRAGYFMPSITAIVVISLIFTNLYQRGGYIAVLASMVCITPPANGWLYYEGTALYAIMGMDIWMAVGYYMLIFLSGLKSIPEELYEAARIQGAGPFRQFFSITLPMLRPVALFILVINSIKSFQVFIEIFVMTKGKFNTASMVYFVYENGLTTGFQFGYASAAAYVLFVIIALFSFLQFFLMRRRQPIW